MKEGKTAAPAHEVARAQRLRLRRILGGTLSYALTMLLVASSWWLGFLDGRYALHFFLAVVAINATAIIMVLSRANLRFEDPSMTGPLIVAALWPSIYVMFHLEEPILRTSFLLMATATLLFGTLTFDLRRMASLVGTVLFSYLVMLLMLALFAPQRLNWRVEVVIVTAYAVSLGHVAVLGSFIAGLRRALRVKNASLTKAMGELEKTMQELEELATRDPLTRLPNRRTAMQQLERELLRAERRKQDGGGGGVCVALLDIDHFKRVNDQFGHQAGDDVLHVFGEALSRVMRQGDFVARFGGEEFLIILPETSLSGGELAVERIRRAIAGIPPESLPTGQPITVSIGLAAHVDGRRIDETLGLADQALYRAKHLGRNRVAVWQEAEPEAGASG